MERVIGQVYQYNFFIILSYSQFKIPSLTGKDIVEYKISKVLDKQNIIYHIAYPSFSLRKTTISY